MARNDPTNLWMSLIMRPRGSCRAAHQAPGDELKDTLDAFVVATEDLCMRLSSHERRGVEAQRERQALAGRCRCSFGQMLKEQAELAEAEDYKGADALQVRVDAAEKWS